MARLGRHSLRRGVAAGLALVFFAVAANARTTMHDLDVEKAKREGIGHEKLLDIPVYMAGQKHRGIAREYGVFRANRRTNAANKSDEVACQIAFLSAVISLQARARDLGGNAVIEVRSITRNDPLVSATQFRCAAGSVVANVALEGRVVKLK